MNGADRLCDVLLANGIDHCFVNPGTSEMHFVAALDRKPQLRCILGLSEGVVTGAADGYARMADSPAATLLHLGPGLANGLANLHNARRARTPVVNVVGDHASDHLALDAPLTSDIESLARPMSHWVGRVAGPSGVRPMAEQAIEAARSAPGVATLILPADAAWGAVPDDDMPGPLPTHMPPAVSDAMLDRAASALRGARSPAIFLGGSAMRAEALGLAGRIAAATGARLFTERAARWQRGAGRVAPTPVPYNIAMAVEMMRDVDAAVAIGGRFPVAFFAYPDKQRRILPEGCAELALAGPEHDLPAVLDALASLVGARKTAPAFVQSRATDLPTPADGALTADAISLVIARLMPEGAIVCEESITSAGRLAALSPGLPHHDHLPLTGGAIGLGIPLATGAAVAAPDRKVIALQADGSGMYTLQGLWTQARERLDILTVVFSNRGYAILKGEMRNVGVNEFGDNARRMLDIDDPALDWCALAKGMGVEAVRADTVAAFREAFASGLARRGPFLIEAVI